MGIVNLDGDMPVSWFLSPTNDEFPEQMTGILKEIRERNAKSKKIVDPAGIEAFEHILEGVKLLFEDDDDAEIEVKYHEVKLGYDIIVKTMDIALANMDLKVLQEILDYVKVFGIDPIDGNWIQLDFGTPRVYKLVGNSNEQ